MALRGRPVLALVPARGGSKGVPRKNLAEICGRPLVEYTLRAGLDAELVDQTYLSSDDAEILSVGESLGAETIVRPALFANDGASCVEVVDHFLSILPRELLGQDPCIVFLQPTSPLRTAAHIDRALRYLEQTDVHTLLSVVLLDKSPFKSFRLNEAGLLQSLFDESLSNMRRQDLPAAYLPNGAMYIFRASDFRKRGGFPSNGSVPFVMSKQDSLDIDSLEDLRKAEEWIGANRG